MIKRCFLASQEPMGTTARSQCSCTSTQKSVKFARRRDLSEKRGITGEVIITRFNCRINVSHINVNYGPSTTQSQRKGTLLYPTARPWMPLGPAETGLNRVAITRRISAGRAVVIGRNAVFAIRST